MTQIISIEAHQGRDIWLYRVLTMWCSACKRKISAPIIYLTTDPCPYCLDCAPKLDEDPLG